MSLKYFINNLPLINSNFDQIIIETVWPPGINLDQPLVDAEDNIKIKIMPIINETTININNTTANQQNQIYIGNISLEELKKTAEHLEIPNIEFLSISINLLTQPNGASNFTYQFNIDTKEFSWRKQISDTAKILYGRTILNESIDYENNMQSLLLRTLELYQDKDEQHKKLLEQYENNKIEYTNLLNEFDRVNGDKNRKEEDLLNKCLLLLNTKKEKIKELNDKIKQMENQQRRSYSKTTDPSAISNLSLIKCHGVGGSNSNNDIESEGIDSEEEKLLNIANNNNRMKKRNLDDENMIVRKRIKIKNTLSSIDTAKCSKDSVEPDEITTTIPTKTNPITEESSDQTSNIYNRNTEELINDM